MISRISTTAVFLQPFELASLNEVLPAGEYEIETELMDPVDWIEPGKWTASVLVHLQPRTSHPGLARALTVPLTELEDAMAKDKLSGKALTDYFLEEMLADPMICLVMQADGVLEDEIRGLYSDKENIPTRQPGAGREQRQNTRGGDGRELFPSIGSTRPGIGE